MNLGTTLLAQLMEFVSWTSFARIVARYSGDARASALPSTERFRIMAYAQITWRESLGDIEANLGANPTKLYAMGLREAVRRSTLADANERRGWCIWADFAAILICRANMLYADEPLGPDVNIAGNVCALDSSTVDVCLSMFDLAPFRSTKEAIKLHMLLDLSGSIPSFVHISDGKMGDNSENGVKTQVWCAIVTSVLIAIVKKELQLKSSLYTCLQILPVSVFESTLISCAFQTDDYPPRR